MFASKATKHNKTPVQTAPTSSMAQCAFYPFLFSFYNYNTSPKFPPSSNYNNSQTVNAASIPKIQRFLEDLDEEFGVGKFTCYSENFINE
jgi:hypothetical protein